MVQADRAAHGVLPLLHSELLLSPPCIQHTPTWPACPVELLTLHPQLGEQLAAAARGSRAGGEGGEQGRRVGREGGRRLKFGPSAYLRSSGKSAQRDFSAVARGRRVARRYLWLSAPYLGRLVSHISEPVCNLTLFMGRGGAAPGPGSLQTPYPKSPQLAAGQPRSLRAWGTLP